jgi:alpha-beta hydrolase superfamily lysophospholipase
MVNHRQQQIRAGDGHDIHVQTWEPDAGPATIVQLLHGLGEHIARYARFAEAAAARGMALVGHDHRGHGPHSDDLGYFAGKDGWGKVVGDVGAVNDWIRERYPDRPVVMLGHSMGSFIAQAFAMHYGDRLKGMLLSASTWPSRIELLPGRAIAFVEAWRLGPAGHSPLLHRLGFADFNRRFKPNRTESDWLSRDETEVDRYIADPLCGGPFSCRLWQDFLAGLWELGSDAALNRIPSGLPVLISGGSADPVGGDKGMTKLLLHYAQTGHGRVKIKIYPDGRHEMLNDINRDEVTGDWLDWISSTVGLGRTR